MATRMISGSVALWLVFFAGMVRGQPHPDYKFILTDAQGPQGSEQMVKVFFDNPNATENIQGWSYGICNDPTELEVLAEFQGDTVMAFNGGDGPDFYAVAFFPNGHTLGVVICLTGCEVLPPGSMYDFQNVFYNLVGPTGTLAVIEFCATLGGPIMTQVIVVPESGQTIVPSTLGGQIAITGTLAFRRGDVDSDSDVDLFDGVRLALALFFDGFPLTCEDAADIDDDGVLNPLGDVLFLLNYLFLSGPPVPAPEPFAPDCGPDPTDDDLKCAGFQENCA